MPDLSSSTGTEPGRTFNGDPKTFQTVTPKFKLGEQVYYKVGHKFIYGRIFVIRLGLFPEGPLFEYGCLHSLRLKEDSRDYLIEYQQPSWMAEHKLLSLADGTKVAIAEREAKKEQLDRELNILRSGDETGLDSL